MTAEKASGAYPEGHDYYAPLLKRRSRATGPDARVFVTPAKDVKDGYRPKTQAIPAAATELETAFYCRKWAKELEGWRKGRTEQKPLPTKHDLGWLCDRFLTDPTSTFRGCREITRRGYEWFCKIIKAENGTNIIADLTGADILKMHHEWGKPVPVLGPDEIQLIDPWGNLVTKASTPQRQRHLIVMLRILAKHGVMIKADGYEYFRDLLSEMEFPVPKARESYPTRKEVERFVAQAKADGYRSIARATLGQFELTERRIHIIGYWENKIWVPGWEWPRIDWRGPDASWKISYYQTKTTEVLRDYDLKLVPELLAMLQEIPEEERWGPVIIAERKRGKGLRQPWRSRHFSAVFRGIATRAGLPADWWSMDMRSGGVTEADRTDGITSRMIQDGAGHADIKTQDIYRREKQRNANKVVELRQAARTNRDE